MEITVYNIEGEATEKKVSLDSSVFDIEPNDHAVYLDVKQYMANRRQGTHKAKERAEIKGSTRKIKRQKGTGTARAGSIKSPLFRGGGRVFGPRPRDYSFKLNKKVKRLARRSALTYKAKEAKIRVLEHFEMAKPHTKELDQILTNLELYNKTLFVLPKEDTNIFLSSRNLPYANVIVASELSTYQIMNADDLVLLEGSVEIIEDILASKK